MPIRIDPVCRNCRGAIHQLASGITWVHTASNMEACPLIAGIANAAPIIRVIPRKK